MGKRNAEKLKRTRVSHLHRLFVTIRLLGIGDSAGCVYVSNASCQFPRSAHIEIGRPEACGSRTVDGQLGVSDNLLDRALLLEVGKGLAGKGAVDLEAIDEGSDGDQAVGLDILLELVVGSLVQDDGVLGLVLDCRVR